MCLADIILSTTAIIRRQSEIVCVGKPSAMNPASKICPFCSGKNNPSFEFCWKCLRALDGSDKKLPVKINTTTQSNTEPSGCALVLIFGLIALVLTFFLFVIPPVGVFLLIILGLGIAG